LSAGGAVWHFAQASPVFCAIAGLAIVCPEANIIIATAAANTALIVITFRIIDLLIIAPIRPAFLR
jgi:hypothetical protein